MRPRLAPVLLAPAAVLTVDPWGWYPFGPIKWTAVSVLVLAGAATTLRVRPSGREVALLGWLAVAAAFGADRLYAWTGTPERHLGLLGWGLIVLALLIGRSLDLARDGSALRWGLVAAGLGGGAVAAAEAVGWEPRWLAVDARLSGTLGSPAFLGAAVGLLLPCLVGIAADRAIERRQRTLAGIGAALLVVAGVGSGARAAWFGLAVAAAVVAVVHRHRVRPVHVGLVAIAVAAVLVLTPAGSRLGSLTDRGEPGGRSRLDEWGVALRVIGQHPLVGVGPEGYRIAFAEGVDASYERAHGRDPLPDRAHSAPLDVALAGGLPALVLWLLVVASFVTAAVRGVRRGPPWLAGVAAGVLAHLTGELLLFPTAELEPVAWLLAGVLLTAFWRHSGRNVGLTDARTARTAAGALAVVALAAGALDVVADRYAQRAAATGDVTAAERAADLRPDEVRLHLLRAQTLLGAQRGTTAALAAVDDALTVSPEDPIALRQRAALLVDRARATGLPEHIDAARHELDRLLTRDPDNAALLILAGAADRLAGDSAAAEVVLRRAADLAPHRAAPLIDLALLYLDDGRRDDARRAADEALTREPDDRGARQLRTVVDR
jgi:O-antigen ligase